LILYRKASQLRIKRATAPEPPYWYATAIAPYGPRRGAPVAIDYLDLRASFVERLEVGVAEHVAEEIERHLTRLQAPVLVEASEFAETVFRRGDEALRACAAAGIAAMQLVSTRGALPEVDADVVVAAWPLHFETLESLFAEAKRRGLRWGAAVPVIFPVTTNLEALGQITEAARSAGAHFLASLSVQLDPTAKQAIAQSLTLSGDDETYTMLFHADLDPLHTATERHIAALATEAGMADFVVPPRWEERTNWNAAILLTLTASRMLAMEHEVELAGTMARSARVVAELDKPLTRIAEAASLSIVEALDEASVDILTEWLETGRSSFAERINARWRLRRDYRTSDARPEPSS
jgi:hypothetical protein